MTVWVPSDQKVRASVLPERHAANTHRPFAHLIEGCRSITGHVHAANCNQSGGRGRVCDLQGVGLPFISPVVAPRMAAVGSGATYAFGAMYVLNKTTKISPIDKLEQALLAASTHHNGCGPPFQFDKL